MPSYGPCPRLPFLVRAKGDQLEPVTESLIKLLLWLSGPPPRSQRMLADACNTSQQRISQILLRQARPAPGSDLAEMLALATEGQATIDGWLLPVEVRARDERRAHARQFAVRFRREELLADPTSRLPVEPFARAGRQLGLVLQPSAPRRRDTPEGNRDERLQLATIDTEALVAELRARVAAEPPPVVTGKE